MTRFPLAAALAFLLLGELRAEPPKPLASFPLGVDKLPFVTLSFGGKGYRCLLDTGTPISGFNEPLRSSLQTSIDGETESTRYFLPRAFIGDFPIPAGTEVACRDISDLGRGFGTTLDGIVGMDILRRVNLSLDFDRSVVELLDPKQKLQATVPTTAIAVLSLPFVSVQVSGLEAAMLVDTGSDHELDLCTKLVDDLRNSQSAVLLGESHRATLRGIEVSRCGVLSAVAMNGSRYGNLQFSEMKHNRWDGAVGLQFLARYNSTFLFSKNELALTKSRWHNAHFWPVLRGMGLVELDGRVIVFSVRQGSPAFQAGVRPDDEFDLPGNFIDSWDMWSETGPLLLKKREPGKATFTAVRID